MILLLHVLVAIASLVMCSISLINVSQKLMRLTYGLVGATLVSGFILVATKPMYLVEACTSGLIYVGVILCGLLGARYRVAHRYISSND